MEQLSALHPTLLRSRFILDSKKGCFWPFFAQLSSSRCFLRCARVLSRALESLQRHSVILSRSPSASKSLRSQQRSHAPNHGHSHSLVDAWSMQLLLQDFEALLRDPEWRSPPERIPFPTYLKDFAARDGPPRESTGRDSSTAFCPLRRCLSRLSSLAPTLLGLHRCSWSRKSSRDLRSTARGTRFHPASFCRGQQCYRQILAVLKQLCCSVWSTAAETSTFRELLIWSVLQSLRCLCRCFSDRLEPAPC